MFILPFAVILYAVLALGAVPPYQFLLLDCVCLAAAAVFTCVSLARSRNGEWTWVIVAGLIALSVGAVKHAPALMIGTWIAIAAKRGSSAQTSRFLLLLVWLGVFEGLFGLIQYFWAPGWIWGLHNPFYKATGTLVNKNHYAGLLDMLIPAAVAGAYYCMTAKERIDRAPLYLLSVLIMSSAVLLSLSRMGIFSLAVSLFTMCALMVWHSKTPHGYLLVMVLVGLLLFSASLAGIDDLVNRFEETQTQDALLRDGRVTTFLGTEQLIRDNPFGVGAGRFEDVFRRYQVFALNVRWDHAHNDYLEFAADFGIPAFVVMFGFLLTVFILVVRKFVRSPSPRIRGYLLACIGAMTAIFVHSFADFNLQIPSNALVFAGIVGFGLGTALRSDRAHGEY